MARPKPLGPHAPKNGGVRPGAGRPKGSVGQATKRSTAIAAKILEGERLVEAVGVELPKDATPLDVMLMAMRASYTLAEQKTVGTGAIAAAPFARDCAPYLHARIAQMELKTKDDKPLVLMFRWQDEE